MKTLLKILLALSIVAVVAVSIVISYDAACPGGPPPAFAAEATPMKAAVFRCYGPPEVVKIETVAKPVPADDEVLVRVHASAVNPVDWHFMRGEPYIMRLSAGLGRPTDTRIGVDFAGTVEAIGRDVTRFKPGDAVFGARGGALAEYIVVKESRNVLRKPERLTFEQAGAVGVAAFTALQALRDHGQLRAGQKVLINGASGGVGTFAVQIAKALGAEVTGVSSTRNLGLVKSLGADHVIDYTQQDFTAGDARYDLVVDNVGNHSFRRISHVLTPNGRYVIVGSTSDNRWLGALTVPLMAKLQSPFVKQQSVFFIAESRPEDLAFLAELITAGKVTPVIDRLFEFGETAEAIGYLEKGRARGKVVVTLVPGIP